MDEAPIIAALCDPAQASRLLLAAAQINSDVRYRHAAGILRGRPAGRRARDDSTAVRQVAALLESGTAGSPEQAARFVARTLDGECSTDAASVRIARKFPHEIR